MHLLEVFKIDDPVGAIPVHLFSSSWGVLAIGLFAQNDFDLLGGNRGIFHGGGFYLLGVQVRLEGDRFAEDGRT